MSSYVRKAVCSVFLSLKSQSRALASLTYLRISVRGLVGMPAGLLLLLCATVAWIFVFLLVPTLLICVWTALQPYRLWLFFRSRMTGKHFSG